MTKMDQQSVERMKQMLREGGSKLTPQRLTILDVIVQEEGNHLTIEEIFEKVRVVKPEMGVATVYRTILLFEELGLVQKLDLNDGIYRYELTHEEETHGHHHLICMACGRVEEVRDDLLDSVEEIIEKDYRFRIKDHSLKFYGLCSDCYKNESEETNEKSK
ncbi:Ferric uptake regulation protein FUR [Clostridiaceae bacterium JG1575]|nr:Ferric uptake regulation protein FUR [Clostridiaceae bacterium JG1575]